MCIREQNTRAISSLGAPHPFGASEGRACVEAIRRACVEPAAPAMGSKAVLARTGLHPGVVTQAVGLEPLLTWEWPSKITVLSKEIIIPFNLGNLQGLEWAWVFF